MTRTRVADRLGSSVVPPTARRWLARLALASAAAVGACTADATIVPSPVASVAFGTERVTLTEGASQPLTVTLTDAAGQPVTGQPVSWSSSNTSVATVSRTGIVTAIAAGEARIAASAFGRSATIPVTVTARPVASVVLRPPSLSLQAGTQAPLQASLTDVDGRLLTGRPITWSSSNAAVASVNASGLVTAVSAGAATITATSEGRSAQSAVTVTLPPVATVTIAPARDTIALGGERTLSAVLRDANGATVTGRAITWGTTDASVASVSSSGLVVGLAPGTATITATSEGRVGSATIVVLARLASSVVLSPATATMVVGTTQTLTAQVTDAQGNILDGRPIAFTSDAPAVATVSAAGVVTGVAAGTARITATSEGKTGTATFTVIPVPVASVQITPASVALVPSAAVQLTAVARAATGAALTDRAITWLSGAPTVATVSTDGRVFAVAPGVALILATADGVTGTVTVTVAPPAVASVLIAPADPIITAGNAVNLSATVFDANGTTLFNRRVTWSSADEAIAFVSSTGQVVGFRTGQVRITATSEGISATTLVTVR